MYEKASMYDKALSLARELPVAYCLKEHGGGVFDESDPKYKACSDLVTSFYRLEHAEVLQYRNILMHGGLSEDLKVNVKNNGDVESKDVSKKDIENIIEKLGNYVDEVIEKFKN